MRRLAFCSLLLALAAATAAAAAGKEYTHQKYFDHYEGTKTCLQCHQKEAESFFHSQHYQWRGQAPDVVNSAGENLVLNIDSYAGFFKKLRFRNKIKSDKLT